MEQFFSKHPQAQIIWRRIDLGLDFERVDPMTFADLF